MAIARQGMVPHAPTTSLANQGTHISSFWFLPPMVRFFLLEEYVSQYVNYPTHAYHDVFGLHTIDTHTSAEDNVNRDVNPRRQKPGNHEPLGPGSDRWRQIQDQICLWSRFGIAQGRFSPRTPKRKTPSEPSHCLWRNSSATSKESKCNDTGPSP